MTLEQWWADGEHVRVELAGDERSVFLRRLGSDPVSGAHMAERIAERLPDAPLLALADVAHWPQLEAPGSVLAALLAD
ncbi:MAG TPA: hypothetical protein VH081_09295 [Solirubrobacteraceae bacterium]|jgi:pimeloyl-ACP methyl ester carboxylesterase|nr:hypothetical protein [Solirubrobacteraceae bacterium]